ncbi:hypothetical protein ACFWIW_10615 [Amycolatopsis sp. NPDC058340]|uniref:hypothetical protein n=1 Tax=Amycolatopsis sp. NPDC058340 TaxID=3346453 RepID=UPI003659892E
MDTTGVLRGVDVSHHQEGLDVGRLPVDYVIARTAQAAGGRYGTTRDRAYAKHKVNAIRGGKLFCSYLYLGNAISAAANVALHASIEPDRGVPVMVDWEDGSGDGAFLRAVISEFGKAGYRVVLTYAPKWYWQKVGSPRLDGLPPLVSSRYPDNNPAGYEAQYEKCPASFWNGYGGNTVGVLQFSSSGRLDPYPGNNLDLLAFRGTRPQFAAVLGGQTQEDDMAWTEADFNTPLFTDNPGTPAARVVRFRDAMSELRAGMKSTTAALQQALQLLADSPDLPVTEERLKEIFREVVRGETGPVVREVLGEDNAAQADAIVDELAQRLQIGGAA